MDKFEKCLENIKLNRFDVIIDSDILKNINNHDENGRTLLHWAAFLGNHKALVCLLQNGANPSLSSEKDENFEAIHFAAVNNHIDCIQTLLDFRVSIESCDMYRRTPLCIAAFYGRISSSVFLLSKQCNAYHRDLNGNNPLHFATLSGNCDLCQILLYSGIDIDITNDFGETAFHLACRKGSKRLLKLLLCRNPRLLQQPDNRGIYPIGHARANRNSVGLDFLTQQQKKTKKINLQWKKTDLLYGRGSTKCPLIFFLAMIFVWAIPVYLKKVLFLTFSDWPIFNWLFIINSMVFMVTLYAVNSCEPGYLPRYTKQYDDILKSISNYNQSECDIFQLLSKLCHSCRTVKPERASHCAICNRCIRHKDHHCPYVYNCVGYRNRQFFLMFLMTTWVGMTMAIGFILILSFGYGYRFGMDDYLGIVVLLVFYLFVNLTLSSTMLGALRNLTSNELNKWKKPGYEYLKNQSGKFENPYDRGAFLNFLEYFRIKVEFNDAHRTLVEV